MSSRTVLEPKHTHSCAKKIIHRADERKRWRFWFFRIRFLLLLLLFFLLPLLRLLRRHHRTSADVINTPRNHIVKTTSFAHDHHHHLHNTIYNVLSTRRHQCNIMHCIINTRSPTRFHQHISIYAAPSTQHIITLHHQTLSTSNHETLAGEYLEPLIVLCHVSLGLIPSNSGRGIIIVEGIFIFGVQMQVYVYAPMST